MNHKRVIEPVVVFLPLLSAGLFIICAILMILISKITILKFLLKYVLGLGVASFIGIMISLIILFVKKELLSYLESIFPTLELHDSLKVYPKVSDFKNQNQRLNRAENDYNWCVRMSYFWQTTRNIRIVIPVPINLDARTIMDERLLKLRKDIVARYTSYSFGKFEQIGGYMILQGNHN
ncbi:hypothetical protein E0700_01190 [Lactobacillus helveticus]|nr:hypothetical protein [Lactobacillus helveticus]MBW8036960.1 hypothetical protein [Lactobacillus helveticus]